MLAVVTVVDDGGDARRAPQGVIFLCLAHFKRLTEQHHKYRCFLAPHRPNTTVCTMFSVLGNKTHGIYSGFWTAPSKNTGIYAIHHVARNNCSMQKSQNPCHLQCFGSSFLGFVGRAEGGLGGVLKYIATSWVINQATGPATFPFTS